MPLINYQWNFLLYLLYLGTLQDRGGMHLITADGSVDCQGIYSTYFNVISSYNLMPQNN